MIIEGDVVGTMFFFAVVLLSTRVLYLISLKCTKSSRDCL